jgi:predicted nucleotidyltransferase
VIKLEQAEQVLEIVTEWGERTREVRALWLTGSFASGTADRFSDIDLRGCIESEEFDYCSSVEDALSRLERWFVLRRRRFSTDRPDSEIVIDFSEGLCLDFHVVPHDRLKPTYFNPYPIHILIDKGCKLTELHSSACSENGSPEPASSGTRISMTMRAWDFLGHAVGEMMRGRHAYALSLLEGARVALGQVLLGRTEAIPLPFSPVSLPKYLPHEDQKIVDSTVPCAAIALIPEVIEALAIALRKQSIELEKSDMTGRLTRMRTSVDNLIQREAIGLAGSKECDDNTMETGMSNREDR